MKKLLTFLILIAAAGGAAFYYFKYGKTVDKPQVIQATISRGDIIEVVSATGTLEPWRRVDVGSQVSGVVQELFVDYNSIVSAGQILAKIDPTLLQVQVDIQKANIDRQLMDIEKQKVQSQASLSQAELNVSYTTIKSPIDGVVVERRVDRGQTVQASMQTPS